MTSPRRVLRSVGLLLSLCLVGGVLVAGMVFPGALALGLVSNDAGDSVNSVSTDLASGQLPQTSTITDSAGAPIAYLFDQNRDPVPSDKISPAMKAAIVAIEDRRFYQHQGVDWQGTIRAVVANSASGDVVQGASTLTQQYVKNYLLYVEARTEAERLKATEQTPARKLREARIALQLERSLSKEEILDRYLNIVFWGNGAYGVSAAARTYFNTTADQLTVAQAAMLAGMVRSTTQFDPVAHPEAALERRNLVIIADGRAGDDRPDAGAVGAGRAAGRSRTRWAPGRTGASARATPGSSASTSPTTWPRRASRSTRSSAAATRSRPRWTATPWRR